MSDLQKHLISKQQSDLLAKEYDKTNYEAINARRPKDKNDAKHFNYDLEVLQEYINLIREGMEKKGIKNKGIRVTLGKYADNNSDSRLNPKYQGYQTIFFSPHDMDSSLSEKIALKIADGEEEDLPNLNYGQICPPY
ncbi:MULTISPECIES: hypothetical protein [unclassified Kaistella]|uniref:hypothetical protein n=1 Tax=unclassified Kaistella TaxID=2762626 RepID=UPI002734A2C7|nr:MULTISPECIES: hypothetical protein [unclassified Kaistella]MCZ2085531.1 hypothetical protein [Flavobacteriales bacterium]MDP2453889.1 hypothetical protein [Kaistella sp. SH11-4b]MDP2456946.1 hypothetical protein [Kaistella sp. SH40-3]MDP2459703.1 hypothetical protein [Kaistella sp. SH19-2b]